MYLLGNAFCDLRAPDSSTNANVIKSIQLESTHICEVLFGVGTGRFCVTITN